MERIQIDGSFGEGGGQILRSALGLSLVTGRPFDIHNIRARRRKPGLMRQHLTGLRAAAQVGDARLDGDTIGSPCIEFEPRAIRGGEHAFQVGSAGSAVLVVQTVLPALLCADRPSTITVTGGTHARWAPSYDFFERAFLPCLRTMGFGVQARLHRHGFFPAGGGEIAVDIEPISATRPARPLDLLERGGDRGRRARALVSNLPVSIADRELRQVGKQLGWNAGRLEALEVQDSPGPGNALVLEVESEHVTEVFCAYGELGVRAERVARDATKQARSYLAADAPVGEYLTDQLLLPMVIAGGGSFRTTKVTRHTHTNLDILARFFDLDVALEPGDRATNITMTVHDASVRPPSPSTP